MVFGVHRVVECASLIDHARTLKHAVVGVAVIDDAPTLLSWLPGETFFSLCSRHHVLTGHSVSSLTTMQLFGHRRQGVQHDLPCRLDAFAQRTDYRLGGPKDIAQERTLLSFYRPFQTQPLNSEVVAAMRGDTVAHVKFRMGLLTSRFRANHPLKACPGCMDRDRREHGWVYWHLRHQYPGVWVCEEHQTLLLNSSLKSTGVERFLWHLPSIGHLTPVAVDEGSASFQSLRHLARFVVELFDRRVTEGGWTGALLQQALRTGLNRRGWLTPSGRLKLNQVWASYLDHVLAIRGVPELSGLAKNEGEAVRDLGLMFHPIRGGTHPLRWLVGASWLFENAEAFAAAIDGLGMSASGGGVAGNVATCRIAIDAKESRQKSTVSDQRQRAIEMIAEGVATTAAAAAVGVAVGTAMAWAAAAGIETKRRAKLLKPKKLQAVVEELQHGADKAEVAIRHDVSVGSITRILRTHPGLHQTWIAARSKRIQETARGSWLSLRETFGSAGIKILRAMDPALYAWLYRNDRDWLKAHQPEPIARHADQQAPAVRWDERDQWMSQRVRTVVLELCAERPRSLKLWEIYQAVPELKPKLRVLDRLPLTRQAIQSALGTRPSSIHPSGDLF
ncbi:TnsD family Tn7-like transposition protein [Hydrogenophaga sp. SL48]|uniref:TnsD family Tn7-like transposition protein n=1 Tax=Hydrogenophaga sp. SL48 TaxID=2806347 RepID=UPI001F17475B|nr:TnsD family Tn7-like transposition protein [Hydrogenophaga sp. SL48]